MNEEKLEPALGESLLVLNNAIQEFGISVGDATRAFLQLRAPYDFPSNIITAPDGIPVSDTEYWQAFHFQAYSLDKDEPILSTVISHE